MLFEVVIRDGYVVSPEGPLASTRIIQAPRELARQSACVYYLRLQ